ncbi:hydroxymethylglutaryl-CoA reductase [Roseofilum casamattae]|uniref:hydroxymethylglutaryl-CoA reductase (NADPH) n=1 Tax=Roseofilum casamattae BLCC-M143 TaxID=3022442 RepID=A0ABT7BSL1_9CYAN|nr:hydroxymethylglutaryl-CoA reductase [Roseofilum casamattae]MDJ1182060.1 hydroxymethylglutaryl-CoA reductase [Roseofilum casamattae BLCC-M143]
MSTPHRQANSFIRQLLHSKSLAELSEQLRPSSEPLPRKFRGSFRLTEQRVQHHWEQLDSIADRQDTPDIQDTLLDPQTLEYLQAYQHNIENFIGTVKLPVGIAGPLRMNGLFAQGDYLIPLATTEAALVASYARGCQLISEAEGCQALLLNEAVNRTPGFAFATLQEVGVFLAWAVSQQDNFQREAEATTRYGKLIDTRFTVEGNHVYLDFQFTTGDAAGQNMVTIATDAICQYILAHTPITPHHWFIEANLSGDKKASAQSFSGVRGKKVTAEVTISATLIEQRLHTTAEQMANYWRMSALGGTMSGTIGVQGHYANGLAALYIACGQDAACVAESAVGVTRFELTSDGGLYAAVTLPNLIVGTVGGGTGLPSQQACLQILGLAGPGHARAFAELCAGLALAGELSIIGALSAGEFVQAHARLARGR